MEYIKRFTVFVTRALNRSFSRQRMAYVLPTIGLGLFACGIGLFDYRYGLVVLGVGLMWYGYLLGVE